MLVRNLVTIYYGLSSNTQIAVTIYYATFSIINNHFRKHQIFCYCRFTIKNLKPVKICHPGLLPPLTPFNSTLKSCLHLVINCPCKNPYSLLISNVNENVLYSCSVLKLSAIQNMHSTLASNSLSLGMPKCNYYGSGYGEILMIFFLNILLLYKVIKKKCHQL